MAEDEIEDEDDAADAQPSSGRVTRFFQDGKERTMSVNAECPLCRLRSGAREFMKAQNAEEACSCAKAPLALIALPMRAAGGGRFFYCPWTLSSKVLCSIALPVRRQAAGRAGRRSKGWLAPCRVSGVGIRGKPGEREMRHEDQIDLSEDA